MARIVSTLIISLQMTMAQKCGKCFDISLDTSNPTESTFVTFDSSCKTPSEFGGSFVCQDDINTFQVYYTFEECNAMLNQVEKDICFYNLV